MKLTYHVSGWTGEVLQAILDTKPAYLKTLDPNEGMLKIITESVPGIRIIYRRVEGNQDIGTSHDGARMSAQGYANRIIADLSYSSNYIWAVEGFNEMLPESASDGRQQLYDVWQAAFYDYITRYTPFVPIAFNFGTGNFPIPQNAIKMHENFPRTLERYDLLGFHEYDWPTMYKTHHESIANGEAGMWLSLRYRRMRAALGDEYLHQKYIITECGMTQGVSGGEDVGWLADPHVTDSSYAKSLIWYNHQLEQDDYVLAGCVFKTGGGTAMWDTFESTSMVRGLLDV